MKDFKHFNQDINDIFEGITDIEDLIELLKIAANKCEKLNNIIEGTNLGTMED